MRGQRRSVMGPRLHHSFCDGPVLGQAAPAGPGRLEGRCGGIDGPVPPGGVSRRAAVFFPALGANRGGNRGLSVPPS